MSNLEILKSAYKDVFCPYISFDELYNQLKLFPCHDYSSSFQSSLPSEFHNCKKCGERLRFNKICDNYLCYIVFESASNAYLVCSCNCLPEKSMDYDNQIYGFREPITLHPKYQNDERYRAVYSRIFSNYKKYKLRAFPNGINHDLFYELRLNAEHEGGSYALKDGTRGYIEYTSKELKVGIFTENKIETIFTLTIPNIIKIINDIIDAYNSNQESLF